MLQERAEQIVTQWQGTRGTLLSLLQHLQSELNYLPPETLPLVAQKLDLPVSQVWSVAGFYSSFSLEPRGEHMVTCCSGTACHVRGGERVAREVSKQLGIQAGQTTQDGAFSFETVNCLGACALGPVVVVDGKYHGKMTPKKVRSLLQNARAAESLL